MSEEIGGNVNQIHIIADTSDSQSNETITKPSLHVLQQSSKSDNIAQSLMKIFRNEPYSSQKGQLTTAYDSMMYNMKHQNRGKCIIFNHKSYDPKCKLVERRGTEADSSALIRCFQSLGFGVNLYNDATAQDIDNILSEASKEDHSNNDCIVVCVLTHGEEGCLWAYDTKYETKLLSNRFKGDVCPSLAGKPKIFLIQSCQGNEEDNGVAVRALKMTDEGRFSEVTRTSSDYIGRYFNTAYTLTNDSGRVEYRIPNFADFLICYSTIPEYCSWRHTIDGSWFIQALTQVLCEHASRLDLMKILTLVSRKVAYEYDTNMQNIPDIDRKKQIPYIASMLTRLVYFESKV